MHKHLIFADGASEKNIVLIFRNCENVHQNALKNVISCYFYYFGIRAEFTSKTFQMFFITMSSGNVMKL